MIKLLVKSNDREYSKAIAFAILEARPGLEVLLDMDESISQNNVNILNISDYLPLYRVLQILDELLNGLNYQFSGSTSSCKGVVITSAFDGNGQSTISLLLGKTLSRLYSKRVLYLNFNKFSEFCFDRLLCSLIKKQEDNSFLSLEFKQDECGLFSPEYNPGLNGLWNLTEEELSIFIDKVQKNFDYVIFDLSSGFPYFDFLCCKSDSVICVENNEKDIEKFFFGFLRFMNKKSIEFKTESEIDASNHDIFSALGQEIQVLAQNIEKEE